jgi:protein gp37
MGRTTGISWCDATWSPWRGCTKVSEGCKNCYADTMSARNHTLFGTWGPNGTRVVSAPRSWSNVRAWDAKAKADGVRIKVFPSLCDPFEEWAGDMLDHTGERLYSRAAQSPVAIDGMVGLTMDDVRARFFELAYETSSIDWLVLTKRPENAPKMLRRIADRYPARDARRAYVTGLLHGNPAPSNLWLGTSVESNEHLGRIEALAEVKAATLWVSGEPLLENVDWRGRLHLIDWLVLGGESGAGARPCDIQWIRRGVEQCKAADVAVYVKQLGSTPIDSVIPRSWTNVTSPGSHYQGVHLTDSKGGDMTEWPEDVRIQEYPK